MNNNKEEIDITYYNNLLYIETFQSGYTVLWLVIQLFKFILTNFWIFGLYITKIV